MIGLDLLFVYMELGCRSFGVVERCAQVTGGSTLCGVYGVRRA